MAAAAALEANSNALTATIGSVYGSDAGKAFDPLWKKHIGFVIDYTTGVAGKDNAKKDKAVDDLLAYSDDFGAFISGASPELTKDTVAELVKTHVLTLKDVVDMQGAKEHTKTYVAIRTAADHMKMISGPLATTIVAQFPDKY
ncbi:MAG TPA: copper amine oxidase N-terminal domain-containing protein, partial [Acidimicrobiia bacterium]|nr:copper amine oxidase N-terminal domain-containing protein [Acidimicrobiia bacterium]